MSDQPILYFDAPCLHDGVPCEGSRRVVVERCVHGNIDPHDYCNCPDSAQFACADCVADVSTGTGDAGTYQMCKGSPTLAVF